MHTGLAHDRLHHRHEADVRVVLKAHHIKSGIFGLPLINDGKAARWHQALGLQLLAAQAHHHHLSAKIRVQTDVAQRADGDFCPRCVNRHAAAIAVRQRHHIVHIRELRQQLGLDSRNGEICHAGHALHSLGDGQNVARTDRAIGIAKALKGVALKRRLQRRLHGGDGQVIQAAHVWHFQQPLMHPTARGNVFERVANRNAVAQHWRVGLQIQQGDFVALRHSVNQHDPRGQHGARGQATVIADDGHVVKRVHADGQRLADLPSFTL